MRILSASVALTASLPYPCAINEVCRPPSYIDDILAVGRVDGAYIYMTYPDYKALVLKYDPSASLVPPGCCGHPAVPFTASWPTSSALPGGAAPMVSMPYAPMAFPSIGTQLTNVAGAAGRVMNAAIRGNQVMADDSVVVDRLAICGKCEFNKNNRCLKCGCYWNVKVKLATEHCPIQKW